MTQELSVWAWRNAAAATLLETSLRATLVVVVALLAAWLLRGRSAAGRRRIWIGALLSLAVVGGVGLLQAWRAASAPAWTWVADDASPLAATFPGTGRIVIGIWLVPSALLLLRLAVTQGRLRRRLSGCRPLSSADWNRDARRIATRMGMRRPVRLLVSPRLDSPFTAGLLRSAIVIPSSLIGSDATLRQSVLWHELAHVRRGDVAARWLAALACAIHWFHPLAWLAARRLRRECECASDDVVLGSGMPGSIYARHLLALADAAPLAAPGIGSSDLCARIEAIAEPRDRRDPGAGLRLALTAAASGLLVLVLQLELPRPRLQFRPAEAAEGVNPWTPAPGEAASRPGAGGGAYSQRSEPTGSTRAARRAGTYEARSATASSSAETPAKVTGSVGVTP